MESYEVVNYLINQNITLNITPTSNLLLGRVVDMKQHPIGKLFRAGVNVTINSDDILMFGSDVSKEYLSLYHNNVLTPNELNQIRVNSLR